MAADDDIYGDGLLGIGPSRPHVSMNEELQAAEASQPQQETADAQLELPERSLEEIAAALADWESTFEAERSEGGAFASITGRVQPLTVLNELHRSLASERRARAEVAAMRQRLAAASAEAVASVQEGVALRKELHAARAAAEPSVLQLRQLLLEPAVNREFAKLAAARDAAMVEASALKDEMRAMHMVVNDPKGPRAMMSQVHALEERCEAMEAAAAESTVAALKRSLEMARTQLEEMRKQYGELEDHAHSLDDEAEVLQRELATARRQAAAAAAGAASIAAPSMGASDLRTDLRGPSSGPRGRGGGPPPFFHRGGPVPPPQQQFMGKRPRDF